MFDQASSVGDFHLEVLQSKEGGAKRLLYGGVPLAPYLGTNSTSEIQTDASRFGSVI